MKKNYMKLRMVFLALLAMVLPNLNAQNGAPHTLKANAVYDKVELSWDSPASPKELRWTTNYDYDGTDGVLKNPQGMITLYAGGKYEKTDLVNYVGETIESVTYFEYQPAYSVTAIIYENGKVVSSQEAPLSAYAKNTFKTITLGKPYTIKKDVEIMVVVKYVYGDNLSFMAIRDKTPTEKGGFYSYDGKNWMKAATSFLVTANLKNNVKATPVGYNVYCDGVKVNTELVTDTTAVLESQKEGVHNYMVGAVYDGDTEVYLSGAVSVKVKNLSSYYPSVSSFATSVDGLTGTLTWTKPLVKTGNELTWSSKEFGNSIGGTASSNTKVWIKNEFTSSDLMTFANNNITAISTSFKEATITGLTLFVMKNGKIDYSEVVSADLIAQIKAGEWISFPLTTPYKIEPGNTYSYGFYCLQTPGTKPISVDNSTNVVDVKSNSFSVTSASSTFNKSNPSWKTLSSGNIPGSWMLTATVEPEGEETLAGDVAGYNVYRGSEKIASEVVGNTYEDTVENIGDYVYSVEAVGVSGKTSDLVTAAASYALPEGYNAPIINTTTFDKDTRKISFNWDMLSELKHYGTVTYAAGFDEDMSLIYGSKLTASELEPYKGYSVQKIKFGIGAAVKGLKLQVYKSDGTLLASEEIDDDVVSTKTMYSLTLSQPVKITGDDDLIIAYNANLTGGTSPILLDAGPAIANGAVVSLSNGTSWMNLGTINSTYKNYNIVISALVGKDDAPADKVIELSSEAVKGLPNNEIIAKVADNDYQYGVKAAKAVRMAVAPKSAPKVATSFKVYKNNEEIAEVSNQEFSETIKDYGIFDYCVTAIYSNGWESKESESVEVNNEAPQLGVAPYNLQGTVNEKDLNLTWEAPSCSPKLSYEVGSLSYGVGMTGSSTRTTYAMAKFPVDSLSKNVGKCISHINFGLYSTDLYSADVVIVDNLNVAYRQSIDLDSLKTYSTDGMNCVRLDIPYEIKAGHELLIGYYITYANGVKPMLCDEGPASDGLGNLISASANTTSWKTLKSLSSTLNYNWRISADLKNMDNKLKSLKSTDEAAATYNVYSNGNLVASNVASTEYTVKNAMTGNYYVTAVKGSEESSPSNVVGVTMSSSVNGVSSNSSMYYDAASMKVYFDGMVSAKVYSVNGTLVKQADSVNSIDMSNVAAGAYVVVTANGEELTILK